MRRGARRWADVAWQRPGGAALALGTHKGSPCLHSDVKLSVNQVKYFRITSSATYIALLA
jgi:hypothetical protein